MNLTRQPRGPVKRNCAQLHDCHLYLAFVRTDISIAYRFVSPSSLHKRCASNVFLRSLVNDKLTTIYQYAMRILLQLQSCCKFTAVMSTNI